MFNRKFLLGILVGQLIMLPYMVRLIKTPRIEALTIPDTYYNFNQTRHLQIKHLRNELHLGGDTLNIYIASEENVNEEFQREFPNETTTVDGFYNTTTNTIWCIYDPLILQHEIRHVTEGAYHR